jgi:hypothetical protein
VGYLAVDNIRVPFSLKIALTASLGVFSLPRKLERRSGFSKLSKFTARVRIRAIFFNFKRQ